MPTEFFYIYERRNIMDSRLSVVVRGRADKKTHGIYILCMFLYYFTLIIICILLYEGGEWREQPYGGFSFEYTAISNLGNPSLNPSGWWVFSIGMIGTGLLLIPQLRYLYAHIRADAKRSAKLIVLCLSLTPIGMIGAGFINEQLFFVVHYIFGAMVFAGLGLAAIYAFFFFVVRLIRRKPWPKLGEFLILYGIVLTACGFLISQLALLGQPGFNAIDLSEWLMLFTLLGWSAGIYLILPGYGDESKIET